MNSLPGVSDDSSLKRALSPLTLCAPPHDASHRRYRLSFLYNIDRTFNTDSSLKEAQAVATRHCSILRPSRVKPVTMQPSDDTATSSPGPAGELENVKEEETNDVPQLPDDADEATRLNFLTTGARDQDDLERDIGRQADHMLTVQADERDKKRMEKTEGEIKRCEVALSKLRARLALPMAQDRKLKLRADIEEQ